MIGQYKNRGFLSKPDIPRVIILEGSKMSGRKTLARWFADKLRAHYLQMDTSVADVRSLSDIANHGINPTVYCIETSEELSVGAQAALLKLLEEPPQKAYFVLICEDALNLSNTLRSRSCVLFMEPYTESELSAYTAANKYFDVRQYEFIFATPGRLKYAQSIGADDFVKFCKDFIENIHEVPLYNALKVTNRIKTKEDSSGYDPDFFLWTVGALYCHQLTIGNVAHVRCCYEAIQVCSKYRRKLKTKGIKKDSLIDMCILDLREVWNDEDTDS